MVENEKHVEPNETGVQDIVEDTQQENTSSFESVSKPVVKSNSGWLFFILLIALVAVAGCVYLWMQQTQIKKQIQVMNVQAVANKAEQNEAGLEKTQVIKNELSTLQKQYQQLYFSFQALQKRQQTELKEDVRLVEAESLLRFAYQRYTLSRDLYATIKAMQLAETLLRERSDAPLMAVRQQILTELELLKNIRQVKTDKSVTLISQLIIMVDKLPLRSAHPRKLTRSQKKDQSDTGKDESFWKGLLKTIQPLVTIRRTEHKTPAMLNSEDERHVRLILKSRLEQLRLSMLQGNEAGVHLLSQQSIEWLTRYFDTQHQDAIQAISDLGKMQELKLSVEFPLIGMARKQLQEFLQQQHVNNPS